MNEPDSMHLKWEPQSGYPGARELYLQTMDALHALSPDGWLYFLEGTAQNNFGLNWGNGFITDYNIIQMYGLSDPNYFFQQLLQKPYANRVSDWAIGAWYLCNSGWHSKLPHPNNHCAVALMCLLQGACTVPMQVSVL